VRVVIADDSVLLREGLTGLLSRFGHDVVAAVGDAPALIRAVGEHEPDVVVTDIRMPPGSRDEGLRAALQLRHARPALPILVLSQYVEQSNAAELLETGPGVGYLLKDRITEVTEFTHALERVAAGGTVIDPDVVRQLLARQRHRLPLQQLTKREHEVLTLVAEGRSNGAIARHLMISEAAIAKNIGAIFVKFGLLPAEDENRRVLAVLTFLRA
jgi:DNA-binding NarL/FixJ family response regulator